MAIGSRFSKTDKYIIIIITVIYIIWGRCKKSIYCNEKKWFCLKLYKKIINQIFFRPFQNLYWVYPTGKKYLIIGFYSPRK